jgi:hypothetical protein
VRTLFSKLISPEQSYAAALRQDTQHQQPQAQQKDGESVRHFVQQHLPQHENQIRGPSAQSPSSSDNDTLKVATVVRQIMTELREAVSEKDKIMVITELLFYLMKLNGCWSS